MPLQVAEKIISEGLLPKIDKTIEKNFLDPSGDPQAFASVDQKKLAARARALACAQRDSGFIEANVQGKVKMTICGVASFDWARRVFPSLAPERAVKKLWEQVFLCSRVSGAATISNMENHIRELEEKQVILNQKRYKYLWYKGPGTDLKVELFDSYRWAVGITRDKGVVTMRNIPTEEIATSPVKGGTQGRVKATFPLVYMGNTITGLWFEFEKGAVVDFGCDDHGELIKGFLAVDEGARYLGEAALVPVSSPISRLGTLFYTTLFDENASCHLALGSGFKFCLDPSLSDEQASAMGLNRSMVHLDFMIGGPELDIIGELKDGSREYILKNGEWAAELF
ncbi:MAG: aminopeptidase [Treponema sp.]|nr:aminopeptidase [Treponema sp.]